MGLIYHSVTWVHAMASLLSATNDYLWYCLCWNDIILFGRYKAYINAQNSLKSHIIGLYLDITQPDCIPKPIQKLARTIRFVQILKYL